MTSIIPVDNQNPTFPNFVSVFGLEVTCCIATIHSFIHVWRSRNLCNCASLKTFIACWTSGSLESILWPLTFSNGKASPYENKQVLRELINLYVHNYNV